MADWKSQVNYNYNSPYYAYAYGVVYQPGPEQNHGNPPNWSDTAGADLSSYSAGSKRTCADASSSFSPKASEDSPPLSPEQSAVSAPCVQSSERFYLGDAQTDRHRPAGSEREAFGAGGHEAKRTWSDSASDSEAHTSPDSWSSGSSRETNLPKVDPALWAQKSVDEGLVRSPGGSEAVSSSLMEESQVVPIPGNCPTVHCPNPTLAHVPQAAPKDLSLTTTEAASKGKVRTAFSESQMNTLMQRFSVQRYLTPTEMKSLAETIGLSYKQVKTWFQNRRMKLRRHQKDSSWVSERYTIKNESPVHAPCFSNMAANMPPYQGEGRPQYMEPYSHYMMEAAFKKTPQNLAYYLAAVGSGPISAGYSPHYATAPKRQHVAGWAVPPGNGCFDYSANTYSSDNGFVHNKDESVSCSMNQMKDA